MSRWLAIFDQKGRIDPEDAIRAFRVYPCFQPSELTQIHVEKNCWMGVLGPSGAVHPSGVSLLWDGAVYNWPGKEADPQYLIENYLEKGRKGLEKLNGRWSFLLRDSRSNTLWLARDRVGVKPLYYWKSAERLVFASEPKLILGLPFVEREIDRESLFDYFVLNQVDTQENTLFKGIRQIMPAHELFVDLNRGIWEGQNYYQLPFNSSRATFDGLKDEEYIRGVRERLETAVQRRVNYYSQAPATLLSGGLDSSTLACLIAKNSPSQITALTASYLEEGIGEQSWAEIVAKRLQARWLQVWPTIDGLRKDLEDFIFSQDTPTFSSGTYSQFSLFRLAGEEHIPFVFDGQGADALFAGHLPHLPPLWRDLFLSGQFATLLREWKSFGPVWKAWAFGATDWLKNKAVPSLTPVFQHRFKKWYYEELRFLNPEILEANRKRYFPISNSGPQTLNHTLHKGYFGGPLSFLLKALDRAASWSGVETCTPYSDDADLMEYVFNIPGSYKIRNGVRKRLLRESCKDLLPLEVTGRQDKMGLVTPNNKWMSELRPLVRDYLEDQDDSVFNKKLLLRECDRFFNPPGSLENYRVYKYLSMLIWRSVFKV